MCESSVRIKNKSRRFDVMVTPQYLDVPCGHCQACDSRKQQDWFVRAVAEYKRVVSRGGFVWFPTLTYNDDCLPYWSDVKYKFSVPVFNRNDFVSFRNKLRVYLKRKGFDCKDENTIRYLYVTEYGGKKGRPHIHCLLFVPFRVPFPLFKSLVKKAWIYGFVRYSPAGDCIKSVKGIQYTMKYMSKDMVWLNEYGVNEYLHNIRSDYVNEKDISKKVMFESIYKNFKRVMPHHCQSMGFGSSFCPSDDEFIKDEIKASDIFLYDTMFNFHVPMYYRRKFLYNYDKVNKLFTINERGKDIVRKRFPYLVRSLERYIASMLDSSIYDTFSKYLPDLETLPMYQNYKNLFQYSTELIAKYMLSFRNVLIPSTMYNSFHEKEEIENFVSENASFYYISRLCNDDIQPFPQGSSIEIDYRKPMFNDINVLCDIECGLQFIESANKLISQYKLDAYYENLFRQQIQFKDI